MKILDEFKFKSGFTPVSFFHDVSLAGRVREEYHVDLMHVNGSRDHWVMGTSNLFSSKKVPIIRTRHNTKPVKNSLANRFLNQRLTDRTISVCQYVKDMLAESPVFKNHEISVVHNGVELEKFSPAEPNMAIREEFGISPEAPVIGIIGRLDWDKGHKYLFEAISPLVKGEFPGLKVVAVGFGRKRKTLEKMCKELGISQNVIFTGRRDDVRQIISIVDVGAQPSIGIDTSSYAMKEMMAMEKPLVCSSYGGLKEINEDGVTGFVVPPKDSNSLRERIAELCRSSELRERMGKAARERVEREFTSLIAVQETLRVYERAIKNSENN
jgi:glycosyltransferase involved in cell wall biosynthesis